MATTRSRDVEFALRVTTLGEQGISDLEQRVRSLAAEGGAAAPEFERLANEIARLGQQARTLDEFSTLTREIDELGLAQNRSAETAAILFQRLQELQAETARLAVSEDAAKTALRESQAALAAKRDALTLLRVETDAAGKKTEQYQSQVRALRLEQLQAEQTVRDLRTAYREAQAQTSSAAEAEKTLRTSYRASATEAERNATALRERNDALREAKGELAVNGIATESLTDAQIALTRALNEAGAAAESVLADRQRATEAARAQAQEEQRLANIVLRTRQQLQDAARAEANAIIADFDRMKQAERDAAQAAAESVLADRQRATEAARAQAQEEQRLANIVLRTRQQLQDAARAEANAIIADFDRMKQAERDAAQAAQDAALKIAGAFTRLGATSVADLRSEIDQTKAAMRTLADSGALSGRELDQAMLVGQRRINALERDIRAATGQLTLMDRAGSALKTTLGQFTAAFGLVEITQRLGSGFFEATKQIESLRLGLNTIYKDSNLTAQQIDFLRKTADQAGISFGSITPEFLKFSASTKAANIPLSETNALFAAVTRAAGTLGLSGDKVSHMLDALSQMAGKGVVSMEELRQQLGDSLPGALSLTAKGLGITDQQLIKLVESGGLLARDLFPALTRSLQVMIGEVDTVSSRWERFKNAITETAQTAGDAGWTDVLKAGITTLGVAVGLVVVPLNALFEIIFGIARAAGVLAGSLATLTSPIEALNKIVEDAARRQSSLTDAFGRLLGTSEQVKASQAKVGETIAATGAAAAAAGNGGIAANTGALQTNATTAGAVATSQAAIGTAAEVAAGKAQAATQSWAQLGVQYAETNKQNLVAVEIAEKVVKSMEIQGRTSIELTQISGNERAALDAAQVAAEGNAAAIQRMSEARNKEVSAMRQQVAALTESARLTGDPDGSRRKAIDELQKLVDVREAEAQKAREQAEAARIEVAQRTVARKTYEDNSASLDLLRTVMVNTQRTLQDYIALERQGFATREQVRQATIAAAQAEGLYRDALADTTAAAERNIQTIQNKNLVDRAALSLQGERARSLEALARANGDEALASQASITSKQVEIRVRLTNASAAAAEATEMLRAADARRVELIARGEFTKVAEAEYNRTKAQADAKRLESEAIKESTKSLEREIETLRNGTTANDGFRQSTDRVTQSVKQQSAALEELYNRNRIQQSTTTADGFAKNADGSAAGTFTNTLPLDQAVRAQQTGGVGMTPQEVTTAFQQGQNAYNDMQALLRLNPGAASIEYQNSVTALFNATRAAFEKLTAGKVGGMPAANAGNGSVHTVNINVGGRTTTVGVTSAADATNLVGTLRTLEFAKESST